MATFISHSPDETAQFAANLARRAQPGWLLGLVGDVGAGKTHFVQAFARGLDVVEPVLSPTFALIHLYSSGRLPLCHIDLYRLQTAEQIIAAGLDEYFAPAGITVVEWWDRWTGQAPPGLRRFSIEALSLTKRRILYDDPGA